MTEEQKKEKIEEKEKEKEEEEEEEELDSEELENVSGGLLGGIRVGPVGIRVGPIGTNIKKYAPDSYVSNQDIYESYRDWCIDNGEKIASSALFGKRIRRLPGFRDGSFAEKRTKKQRGFVGIRLAEEKNPGLVI